MDRKLSNRDVSLKAMTELGNQMENKIGLLESETRLDANTNMEPMRKYGQQNIMVRKAVGKLLKTVPTDVFSSAICISRAISKGYLTKMSEPDYYRTYLRKK